MQNNDLQTMGEILQVKDEASSLTWGYSMYPMLRPHKDVVTVSKVNGKLKKGDVVLYPGNDGKFILHRIMRIKPDVFIIRGDNNYFTEIIKKDKIIGLLKEFYRGGKYINCETNIKYKLYTFYICHSYYLRYFWKKILFSILCKVKVKLFPNWHISKRK